MTDSLLEPPPFLLAEQYASALTTLGLALCWMPVLPVSPFLAALGGHVAARGPGRWLGWMLHGLGGSLERSLQG